MLPSGPSVVSCTKWRRFHSSHGPRASPDLGEKQNIAKQNNPNPAGLGNQISVREERGSGLEAMTRLVEDVIDLCRESLLLWASFKEF